MYVIMASTSGIRATGSGFCDYVKKIILKDAATCGPWKARLTSILDAEDCWEIVNGAEVEPVMVAYVEGDLLTDNKAEVDFCSCVRFFFDRKHPGVACENVQNTQKI